MKKVQTKTARESEEWEESAAHWRPCKSEPHNNAHIQIPEVGAEEWSPLSSHLAKRPRLFSDPLPRTIHAPQAIQ